MYNNSDRNWHDKSFPKTFMRNIKKILKNLVNSVFLKTKLVGQPKMLPGIVTSEEVFKTILYK